MTVADQVVVQERGQGGGGQDGGTGPGGVTRTKAKELALAQAGVSNGTTPDSQELPTEGQEPATHTEDIINMTTEAPMQAAKVASEGGIILCGHILILTRWKDNKTQKEEHLKDYIGKVAVQFDIDTTSQPVIEACTDMLKSQQRQGKYRLKKKVFNDVPANEVPTKSPVTNLNDNQWNNLVTM
uniref:Uncharacterized protein n=1 Tax=Setaria viridis TaxID=4556 RepID=A0A4U6WK02_SETVI|nr:hypothetical protein SEVIR_1G120300v2 [Setaria viridis]